MRDNSKKVLIQYIRRFDKTPVGVVVAVPHQDNRYVLGVAICNKKDRFKRHDGVALATERAEKEEKFPDVKIRGWIWKGCHIEPVFGDIVQETIEQMTKRANKYYKVNQ